MLIKNNLRKLKKVGVSIWKKGDNARMPNGKNSVTFTVYDTTPEEVYRVIQRALEQHAKN